MTNEELLCLYEYSKGKKFIIETGGGESTVSIAKASRENDAIFVSIDVSAKVKFNKEDGVIYRTGWSVLYEDFIFPGEELFKDIFKSKTRKKYPWADAKVVKQNKKYMIGETDLIRQVIKEYKIPLDLFFCDTGEYSGLAEWNIVKNKLPVGGIFICHDIYYPKSIKCFQVHKQIKMSDQWEIIKEIKTRQGMLVSKKIK